MKAGILGGTFDPVHCGHLFLAERVKEELSLDQIIFLPLNLPPHKPAPQQSGEVRLALLEQAIAGKNGFSISTLELERSGLTYTVDTLRELQKQGKEYYYIIGSDTLLDLYKWREFEKVLKLTSFVCILRPGAEDVTTTIEKYRKDYGARIQTLRITAPNISSTEIRERVAKNEDITGLVPETIRAEIKKYYR